MTGQFPENIICELKHKKTYNKDLYNLKTLKV